MRLLEVIGDIRWKLAAGGAAIVIAIAAFFLLQAQTENRHLTKLNNQLDARINDPSTGYIVQLAQATTNVATLRTAVDRQNITIRTNAAATDHRLTALRAELVRVERVNVGLRADAGRILNASPVGTTLEQRMLDIDQRVLETLE